MLSYPFNFPKIRGRFIRRLNRFVVEAEIEGRPVKAYLANPGRLWELMLPGTELLLNPSLSSGKLPYTVLACKKENLPILLHTHLTNRVIRALIDERQIPAYAEYRVVKTEPACGRHRFDLLLEHRHSGRPCYLEIKSVTLFESRTAMFPDAVTKRGAQHLRLLKDLSDQGLETSCLFAIMNPGIKYFIPAYHVDFVFAQTLLDVRLAVQLNAFALGFDDSFTKVASVEQAVIPYDFFEGELQDRGIYLLLLYLRRAKVITLKGGERVEFKEGCYVYTSRAQKDLNREIARLKQKRVGKEAPIDFLIAEADAITPVPVLTRENIEGELSGSLEAMADGPAAGLNCYEGMERLFYFAADPLHNRAFVDLIAHYRLVRPEEMLKTKPGCNAP